MQGKEKKKIEKLFRQKFLFSYDLLKNKIQNNYTLNNKFFYPSYFIDISWLRK